MDALRDSALQGVRQATCAGEISVDMWLEKLVMGPIFCSNDDGEVPRDIRYVGYSPIGMALSPCF